MPRRARTAGRWPAPEGLREALARATNIDRALQLYCDEMAPDATSNGRSLDDMRRLRDESEQRRADILAGAPVTFRPIGLARRLLGDAPGITWRSELRLAETDHLTVVS